MQAGPGTPLAPARVTVELRCPGGSPAGAVWGLLAACRYLAASVDVCNRVPRRGGGSGGRPVDDGECLVCALVSHCRSRGHGDPVAIKLPDSGGCPGYLSTFLLNPTSPNPIFFSSLSSQASGDSRLGVQGRTPSLVLSEAVESSVPSRFLMHVECPFKGASC